MLPTRIVSNRRAYMRPSARTHQVDGPELSPNPASFERREIQKLTAGRVSETVLVERWKVRTLFTIVNSLPREGVSSQVYA